MQVAIDSARCCAAGVCEVEMPDVFEVQDEGATRVVSQPREDRREALMGVVRDCPTNAILVTE